MQLSKNFTAEDFIKGRDLAFLKSLCSNILEPIRRKFGPIKIDRTYIGAKLVRFSVPGFKSDIIKDYIENCLIYGCVSLEEDGNLLVSTEED